MKPLVHALPHQSRPLRGAPASPRGKPRGMVRIRLGFYKSVGAYRNPSVSPYGLPAPLSGALFSLPPLGEVPRSGKGGAVGIFELFPFNEPHPLSQPCRFRSAVKSASSPIGEPRGGLHEFAQGFIKPQVSTAKPLCDSLRAA